LEKISFIMIVLLAGVLASTLASAGFCGDNLVGPGEQCELPTTNNNQNCAQAATVCDGVKTGVRDSYGYCGIDCNCIPDQYSYTCMKNSCGATCSNDADCNDNNPNTRDSCLSGCECSHVATPYCGNKQIDAGEQCEANIDCGTGKICTQCRCVVQSYCGDGQINNGELCDYGAKVNGVPCVPSRYGNCSYCTSNCTWKNLTGGSCGNALIEYGEECDEGGSNGASCTPGCDDFCNYCTVNCTMGFVHGTDCSGGTIITDSGYMDEYDAYYTNDYYCPWSYCPATDYYGASSGPKAGICGDRLISVGEDCDLGYNNGIACSPSCGSTCSYCNSNCEEVTLDGGPCTRTPRPWDEVAINPCKSTKVPITSAKLDNACSGNGADVTNAVKDSENKRAIQSSCMMNPTFIYLTWQGLNPANLRNITLYLEHFEENADIRVEYYNGSAWLYECDVPREQHDLLDSCMIRGVKDPEEIKLRVKVLREGSNAMENLDQAYLVVDYCKGLASCGNGLLDQGEGCDDGNHVSGDGCDEFCTKENMLCTEWGECLDGRQTQICYFGSTAKSNIKNCTGAYYAENFLTIILVFLLVLLVLAFLFFPIIYYAINQKMDKMK
jgi:cysteine-rich repeat protein